MVSEKEDPPSRRVGRPKSEFKFVRHCVLCVIGFINSLETEVAEEDDPPSKRAEPKSEFNLSVIVYCELLVF